MRAVPGRLPMMYIIVYYLLAVPILTFVVFKPTWMFLGKIDMYFIRYHLSMLGEVLRWALFAVLIPSSYFGKMKWFPRIKWVTTVQPLDDSLVEIDGRKAYGVLCGVLFVVLFGYLIAYTSFLSSMTVDNILHFTLRLLLGVFVIAWSFRYVFGISGSNNGEVRN